LTRAVRRTSKVTIGADLKFLKPAIEKSVEDEGEVFLEALGQGCNDPLWSFKRTASQNLAGIHELSMVVALPANVRCKALLSLSADIRRKRAGLFGYEVEMPPELGIVDLT
jgi:hypothetical protein